MSYRDRVSSPGPKKLLALDGGGIRGVITLEVLRRLESLLAKHLGAGDEFVLADYFDYIGGTSTGAVIAAGLARGVRVAQLLDLYVHRGEEMFDHASLRRRYHYRYGSVRLRQQLQGLLYVRYNPELSRRGLDDLGLHDVVPEQVQRLDSVQPVGELRRVGQAAALEHFAGFL